MPAAAEVLKRENLFVLLTELFPQLREPLSLVVELFRLLSGLLTSLEELFLQLAELCVLVDEEMF
jgi:hypothetical protein